MRSPRLVKNPTHRLFRTLRISFPLLLAFLFTVNCTSQVSAQKLPNKIDGYKVHRANVLVKTNLSVTRKPKGTVVVVSFDKPRLSGVSLTSFAISVKSSMTAFGHSGTIESIAFEDFSINGRRVNVRTYKNEFKFKKGKQVVLTNPFMIDIGAISGINAAISELFESKETWHVAGKILVFGRFKKSIFSFKRVIPVDINLQIASPFAPTPKPSN